MTRRARGAPERPEMTIGTPHLNKTKTRHGKTVYYVRMTDASRTRIRLRATYGTPAFWSEYGLALERARAASSEMLADVVLKETSAPCARPLLKRASFEKVTKIRSSIPAGIVIADGDCRSFVYFIRVGSAVKIGMSNNVRARGAALQTARDERIEILYSLKGGPSTERYFHRLFSRERIPGEWLLYEGAIKNFLGGLPYAESEHSISL
ncbi:MAG: GIY-YIG nuclease family protein [Alphaproteobacteria bacterium]|nr:GIY-YIG nuclease family protein [Alphaproteobacteria bacterium]